MTALRTHIGLPVSQLDAARQTLGDSYPVGFAGTRARDRHSHQLTRRFRPASVQESGNLRASPCGHLEPTDTRLVGAALRELSEETGIDPEQVVSVSGHPACVEFGQVPARPAKDEPDHYHLDGAMKPGAIPLLGVQGEAAGVHSMSRGGRPAGAPGAVVMASPSRTGCGWHGAGGVWGRRREAGRLRRCRRPSAGSPCPPTRRVTVGCGP
ncbi:NUDIX domain-containing protein [Streptomyces clavifer]|uniref:NUDIX domain-containing protein n=1 Tax=Streptomyces clavifer TaxID=68188 RepID=UPI0030850976|nr:NUDIX domain-containing protein [Streptomyces clavifer]WRY86441.1 NUDIX domain-containing protein [Streptomyces clavifer]